MNDKDWVQEYLEDRKYSPDQPRAPAGSPEGGQWTSGGSTGGFSGGGYTPIGFPGDSNQSQAGWRRGEGDDRQIVRAYYVRGERKKPFAVHHGTPDSHWVTSSRDVAWDYDSRETFASGKDAAKYLKERYGIDWDGEFQHTQRQPTGSPSRRMGAQQIAQAVARGDLTPEQAARIKF